jgi:hypothetical protein
MQSRSSRFNVQHLRAICNNPGTMETVVAVKLSTPVDAAGFPQPSAWGDTIPTAFCADWRGENADPLRETEVRLLWTRHRLYVRFQCRYRGINVYEASGGRRDELWMKDVAEIFIQRGTDALRHYKEFEISPNGDWLDLDINEGQKTFLMCELTVRVVRRAHVWSAEMGVPMSVFCTEFDPRETWRLNLFRIEGQETERYYSAWRPTYTPKPNFHVPERFGELRFQNV